MNPLRALLFIALTTPLLAQAQETLIAYWNMDATAVLDKFEANAGSQAEAVVMDASPSGFLSDLGNDTGTNINLYGEEGDPNQALEFYTGLNFGNDGQLEIFNLDFTNMTEVVISFAIRADNSFTWNQHLHVDYSLDNGENWIDWDENRTTNNGQYELESIAMPDIIDGKDNIALSIRTSSWININGKVDFDNIQITAVPEPGTWSTLAALGALTVVLRRRLKR